MKFSYNSVWDDTLRLLKAHGALLAAIAGVFVFLPNLLLEHFRPPPVHGPETMEAYVRLFLDYLRENKLWIVAASFVVMMGSLAMLRLVFAAKATVGAALASALMLLPAYSLLIAVECVILALGLFLLIVPGLYLAGRLAPVGAVMVAEDRRNAIDALKRSFALTKDRGWAVFGLVFVVYLTGMIISKMIEYLAGSLLILVAGQALGRFLTVIVTSAVGAVFLTVLTMLYAAIYRALAAPQAAGPDLKKAA